MVIPPSFVFCGFALSPAELTGPLVTGGGLVIRFFAGPVYSYFGAPSWDFPRLCSDPSLDETAENPNWETRRVDPWPLWGQGAPKYEFTGPAKNRITSPPPETRRPVSSAGERATPQNTKEGGITPAVG